MNGSGDEPNEIVRRHGESIGDWLNIMQRIIDVSRVKGLNFEEQAW